MVASSEPPPASPRQASGKDERVSVLCSRSPNSAEMPGVLGYQISSHRSQGELRHLLELDPQLWLFPRSKVHTETSESFPLREMSGYCLEELAQRERHVSQHFIQLSHLSAKTTPPHEGAKSQVRDSSVCFERKYNHQCVNIANGGVM